MEDTLVRILLVEDNPGDARLIRETLREAVSLQFELCHVERLSEARDHCTGQAVDVVLLDLSLSDVRGIETVSQCLSFAAGLPIIVLTGLDDERVAVQAVQAGAQDYLVKGQVDSTLLVRSIRYAVERKRLDLERLQLLIREREARSAAEAAVAARDEVLRVVSHDLGNSLSAVKIHAVVLGRVLSRDAEPEPELSTRIEAIKDLVTQMHRLRQDLLDIASIDAGRLSVETATHAVGALIESAVAAVRDRAAEKSIRLDIPATIDQIVQADRDRMLQVLGNLLGNAIKFAPEGGSVTIRAEEEVGTNGAMVRFTVADTGVGIAAEHLPHVFDRFWKMKSGNPGGTGLGLAIARGIVEAHGGSISVESRVGEGTTVSFTIPAGSSGEDRNDLKIQPL
jgi:signal transduction histidine kinase